MAFPVPLVFVEGLVRFIAFFGLGWSNAGEQRQQNRGGGERCCNCSGAMASRSW